MNPLAIARVILPMLLLASVAIAPAIPTGAQPASGGEPGSGAGQAAAPGNGTVVGKFSIAWPHSVLMYAQSGITSQDAGSWSASGMFTVNLATGQVSDGNVTLRPTSPTAQQFSGPIDLADGNDSFVTCGVYDGLGGIDIHRYPQLQQTGYSAAPTVTTHDVQEPHDVCGLMQLPPLDQSVSLGYSSLSGLTGIFIKLDNSKQFDLTGPHAVLAINLYQSTNQTQDEWDQQPLVPKQGLQAPAPGVWNATFYFDLLTGSPGNVTYVTSEVDLAKFPFQGGGTISFAGAPPPRQCVASLLVDSPQGGSGATLDQHVPDQVAQGPAPSSALATASACTIKLMTLDDNGKSHEQDVTGRDDTDPVHVVVGQQIQLSVEPAAAQGESWSLDPQGGPVAGFRVDDQCPKNGKPSLPLPACTGAVDQLTEVALGQSPLTFYWTKPGTYTVTYGSTLPVSATFEVDAPQSSLSLTYTGAPEYWPLGSRNPNILACGVWPSELSKSDPAAPCYELTVSPATLAPSAIEFVQLIAHDVADIMDSGGLTYHCVVKNNEASAHELDTSYPDYAVLSRNGTTFAWDTPGWPLYLVPSTVYITANLEARLFLLWNPHLVDNQPSSKFTNLHENSIWVPLGNVEWTWTGSAGRDTNGNWETPTQNLQMGKFQSDATYPEWSAVIVGEAPPLVCEG